MNPVEHLNAALAGRYEIEREIGAGGMATVYLARDVRHHRSVALKLLSPELGAVLGGERFLSEIQVTANLQHPNLLPLFDSGEADGLLYYVMPYIAGESLRARLHREKQLPIDDAIQIAVALASALDYAHRQGVVHRDLKPENVLLHEGQPLIADFGIALAVSKAGGSRITQTGLSLGTPQYMSPEQATGDRAIDGRTDIYSLGAMLYEMLAGDPPYTGSTTQAIIAKVITERPRSVRLARATVQVNVDRAIDRALAKLPADRWHTAHEFSDALLGRAIVPISPADAGDVPAVHAGSDRSVVRALSSPLPWVAAFVIAATVALWSLLGQERPAGDAPVRFALSLLANERLAFTVAQPIAIAPNGRVIVYAGARQLFARNVGELRARALPGTENAIAPAVSPDARWVTFISLGKLKKVPIDGGPPAVLSEAPAASGAAWLSNQEIIFSRAGPHGGSTLWHVSSGGGKASPIADLDSASGERFQWYPFVLAKEQVVLYTSLGRAGIAGPRLAAFSLKTRRSTQLDLEGTYILGFVEDHLIYVRQDGVLMAVGFDARRIQVTGTPLPLAEGVQVQIGGAAAALSSNGTLVYLHGAITSQVVLVDEQGSAKTLLQEKRRYVHPRFSPDGRRIAFDVGSAQTTDIWVADIASGTFTRLTTVGNNDRPEWSPDGKRILFLANRDSIGAPWGIWWQPADGSRPAERIFLGTYDIREVLMTRDSRAVVYREDNAQNRRDILLLPLDTPRTSRPLLVSGFDELMPRISADGRWLAYISDESGQFEVYVTSFPAVGGRFQVSVGGGTEPLWSPDGARLFYRNGDQLVAATLVTRPSLSITGRAVLFVGDFGMHPYHPNYDVAPDGRHFAMLKASDEEAQVVVVVNWLSELRQRIQAAR